MQLSGETVEIQEDRFILDAVEDQSLAEKNPVICIELGQQDCETQYRGSMVWVRAITAVPSTRQQETFQRIGFARFKRTATDLPKSEFVIV